MKNLSVTVEHQMIQYPLVIEKGLLARLGEAVRAYLRPACRIGLVTDQHVADLYLETARTQLEEAGFQVFPIVVAPGEESKSLRKLTAIWEGLLAKGFTRSDAILAVGGGVVGDLAGFAAATFLRGLSLIQVPTTLLAQVDSSVGGKVAVDLTEGKNLVGAFYHPKAVLMDPDVLETLSSGHFSAGLAEVIKYGLIQDADFFRQLEQQTSRSAIMAAIEAILARCCELKRDLVALDERDQGQRMLLNFGHTIGHAIEAYYGYQNYTHGQAVAIGMVYISAWAEAKGYSPHGLTERIRQVLLDHDLPVELAQEEDLPQILPLIRRDKKNLGQSLHVVVVKAVGEAHLLEVGKSFEQELLDVLARRKN